MALVVADLPVLRQSACARDLSCRHLFGACLMNNSRKKVRIMRVVEKQGMMYA